MGAGIFEVGMLARAALPEMMASPSSNGKGASEVPAEAKAAS